ncbi:SMI1/KNR4 family protein [Paenibacillus arenosi]|uniref:SMI1/KNR4 family protein n=1 Tax=Paenibacillus arenosi TaxID=2774142 RepID=A0ABR9AWX4_9BACL|nr:SMI1/KNR4 family protein [Paenibacillus arenosi]MBD8498639.1 SMI1/KNR4 family protein [Paenibacillus arenosi]
MTVEQTINSLRELYAHGTRKIQCNEGYVYDSELKFYDPSSDNDISLLLESYSPLPEDYLKFLSITNGFRPFSNVECSGEIEIFSIDEILSSNEPYDDPTKVIVACVYNDYFIIDTEAVAQGKKDYMYLLEGISDFDDARSLYCDFQTWLDRFVMAQGNKYWTWRVEDRKF